MTKFVCLTSIATGNTVTVNPAYVTSILLSDFWYDSADDTDHEGSCVKLKMAQKYTIQVKESYEEVLKAFEEAGVQIRKVKSNG